MNHSNRTRTALACCAFVATTLSMNSSCSAAVADFDASLDDAGPVLRVVGRTPFPRWVLPSEWLDTRHDDSPPLRFSLCAPDLYCGLTPEPSE